jgi:fatty-acyl-CoA synthase
MAAIVVNERFDLGELWAHLVARLPDYARPLFLRLCGDELELTGTFKHKKSELVREGYAPCLTGDRLYFNDSERGAFIELDHTLYERIQTGQMRI